MSPKAENKRRARKVYALTDQLQVQLRALDEAPAPVDLRVISQPATDMGALAFLVLMQAAESAQEDLPGGDGAGHCDHHDQEGVPG